MEQTAAETFVDEPALRRAKRNKRLRMGALVLLFVGSLVIAKVTGLWDHVSKEEIRGFMDGLGAPGFLGYIVAFAFGQIFHVPGWIFVLTALVAYGKPLALPAAYFGANFGFAVSFLVIRAIGGQPLGEPRAPMFEQLRRRPIAQKPLVRSFLGAATWLDRQFRRVMARIDSHPIQTIAILRLVFWFAPWLTYMLAMSKVKLKDYVIGSMLGIAAPIALLVFSFDWLETLLGRFGLW